MSAPQPLVVVTGWGARALPPLGVLLAFVVAASIVYAIALRRGRLSLATILTVAAIEMAAAWCAPAVFSSDVYAYAAYGEMSRVGLDPYALAPAPSADPFVRAAQLQWVTAFPICVYGPAFVALARAIVALLGKYGIATVLGAFRLAACGAFLCCIALLYGVIAGDRTRRGAAAATLGLNPAAIWCAAEGHNDALALAIVLGGLLLVRRGAPAWGALLVALSATVKLPGIAVAAILAALDRRARVGAVAGIAIALLVCAPLAVAVMTRLGPHGSYAPQASLQAIVAPLGPIAAWGVALAVAAALTARSVMLLRLREHEGWIWLGLAVWVLIPNPYPWYSLWLVALCALAPGSRAGLVGLALSFTSLLRYLPDAAGVPSPPLAAALGAAAVFPLLALLGRRSCYNGRLP